MSMLKTTHCDKSAAYIAGMELKYLWWIYLHHMLQEGVIISKALFGVKVAEKPTLAEKELRK